MNLFLRSLAIAILGMAFGVAPARAETFRLNYQASVLGVVELGVASYEVTSRAGQYAARGNVRTSGFARIFDQTEINAASTGALSGASPAWNSYNLSHAYSGKFRRISMSRGSGGVSAQINPTYSNAGSPPASTAQQAAAYDPLSGVFALGQQIGAAGRCSGSVQVYDGRQLYRLALGGGSPGTFNAGGYDGPSITCSLRYEPIAGFNMSAEERARIPVVEATFGLPPGAQFAPPLRLSVPTPVGQALLNLSTYQRQQ